MVKVFELANSLGVDAEKVLKAAKKLKIAGKLQHITELTDVEAKDIKKAFTQGILVKKTSTLSKKTTAKLVPKVTAKKTVKAEPATGEKKVKKTASKPKTAESAKEVDAPKDTAKSPAKSTKTKKKLELVENTAEKPTDKNSQAPVQPTAAKKDPESPVDPKPVKIVTNEKTTPENEKPATEKLTQSPATEQAPEKVENHTPTDAVNPINAMTRVEFGSAGTTYSKSSKKDVDKLASQANTTEPKKTNKAVIVKHPKSKATDFKFLFKSDRKKPAAIAEEKSKLDVDVIGEPVKKKPWKEKRFSKNQLDTDNESQADFPKNYVGIKAFRKQKERKAKAVIPTRKKDIVIGSSVSIMELSNLTGLKASELIKALFNLDILVTINQTITGETAQLICSELGLDIKINAFDPDSLLEEKDDPKAQKRRDPVVTIMGHVDHGKTSLLDFIRKSKIADKESGGITQHIGAYRVKHGEHSITFLDTPGHEAFTAMRSRGANATDIVVLVVAADDGPKPQTVEAINHSKAAGAPIVVAVNKCDKPNAQPDKAKQQLVEHGLQAEEFGGDVPMINVSAKTGEGLEELLQMLVLQAEIMELKANPLLHARGVVLESRLDKIRGNLMTLLVQTGTLHVGDIVVADTAYGRVRAMYNEYGKNIKEALPACPVEILGFDELARVGEKFYAVADEKIAKTVVNERKNKANAASLNTANEVKFEDLFKQERSNEQKVVLNLIVKADVQGSLEAIRESLTRWNSDQVDVKLIHASVGAINSSDINLASASKAIVVGFNVRPDSNAKALSEQEKVSIKLYSVIYKLLEDIKRALEGLFDPILTEEEVGKAEVLNIFTIPKIGVVAGCKVSEGKVSQSCLVRVLRDNIVIHQGKISSLRRFKEAAKEVFAGFECGLVLDNYKNVREGDLLEFYTETKENVVLS